MKRGGPDLVLFGAVMALVTIGIIIVYSASYPKAAAITMSRQAGLPPAQQATPAQLVEATVAQQQVFLRKQAQWAGIGLVVLIFAMTIPLSLLRDPRFVIFVVGTAVVLLLLPFVPGMGTNHGTFARRWVKLGPMTLQPSEFGKFAVVLYLAFALDHAKRRLNRPDVLLRVLSVVLLVLGLIFVEPHLGGTLVLAATAAGMLWVAGLARGWWLTGGLIGVALVTLSMLAQPYQRDRITAWLDPVQYADDIGFQTVHCESALARGGWSGRGLGRSIEKFYYLPECHSDSILAVLGEEFGLLGTGSVVLLFLLLGQRGLQVAARQEDEFSRLLAVGLTCGLFLQALLNIGVTSGLLPQTGVGLQFITYGGSSLVFCLGAVGLLMNLSRQWFDPAERAAAEDDETNGYTLTSKGLKEHS